MPVDRHAIKAAARERLSRARPSPLLEGLLFVLAAGALSALAAALLASGITPEGADTYMKYILAGRYEEAVNYLSGMGPSTLDYFLSQAISILRGIVAAGFSLFALNTLREKEETSLWNLLDGFGRFLPLLLLLILSRFLITAWSYLFVIPGIIAFYRYRLAVYLLLDHPQLNAFQCLLLSGRMMRGRKIQLLLLDLSFLGWGLLAGLPLLFGAALGLVPMIAGALGSAGILVWVAPYFELSCAGFYEAVKLPVETIVPGE